MRNKIDPYRYSQKILPRHLKRFLKERKDVLRSSGIEPVHRMRVASRRLRAALSVFKSILPVKKAKVWRREISKISRALGRARQLDVQIKFLKAAKERFKKDSRVVHTEAIIKSLKKKRRKAQKRIDIVLADFEIKKRLPGLKACLNGLSSSAQMRLRDAFNVPRGAIILRQLDKLLEFTPYVSRPQSITELHCLRIAAKKLRYTLEIFWPWYGVRFDEYIRASRDIQDLLGDLHEFDVIIEVLSVFSKKGNKGFNDTIAYLTRECLRLRQGVYIKFIQLWRDLEERRLWVRLRGEI
ncbi:MAG: CHAD domain-containing protein [Candidatus Omnitrophota bacterium]